MPSGALIAWSIDTEDAVQTISHLIMLHVLIESNLNSHPSACTAPELEV